MSIYALLLTFAPIPAPVWDSTLYADNNIESHIVQCTPAGCLVCLHSHTTPCLGFLSPWTLKGTDWWVSRFFSLSLGQPAKGTIKVWLEVRPPSKQPDAGPPVPEAEIPPLEQEIRYVSGRPSSQSAASATR